MDEDIALSDHALSALKEHLQEQYNLLQAKEELTTTQVVEEGDPGIEHFAEDWGLSQFWYDDETSDLVAQEAVERAGDGGRIACLCTPSVFRALRRMKPKRVSYVLFEYDKRFQVFGEQYEFYDYNFPLSVSSNLKQHFNVVVVDPPYLTEECYSKVLQTIHIIEEVGSEISKIFLTGEKLASFLLHAVGGLRICSWRPKHVNNLANEFCCYTNYDCKRFGYTDEEATERLRQN